MVASKRPMISPTGKQSTLVIKGGDHGAKEPLSSKTAIAGGDRMCHPHVEKTNRLSLGYPLDLSREVQLNMQLNIRRCRLRYETQRPHGLRCRQPILKLNWPTHLPEEV